MVNHLNDIEDFLLHFRARLLPVHNHICLLMMSETKGREGLPLRLLQLRIQKQLTQKSLADIVSLHKNHIGRYERGLSEPSAEKLKALAEALGMSVDYLLNGTEESAARADFEDRELLSMFQTIEQWEERDKQTVKEFLDAMITKKKLKELAS